MNDLSVFAFGAMMSNIGDQIQRVGFMNALSRAGIRVSEQDVVYGYRKRPKRELWYIAYGYYDYQYPLELFPFTEKEHPFFLSTHCTDDKRVEDLKQIRLPFFGCRDYATYRFMDQNFPQTPHFLTGCYSLVQERRKKPPVNGGEVYCVDVVKELEPHIPKELWKDAVFQKHDNFFFSEDDRQADEKATAYVNRWLAELREKARLVITSRLHCALPCIAMGIPVVVARGYRDNTDRYTGYEKLFPLYMPDEFDRIDWDPDVPDVEWIKDLLAQNTKILVDAIREGAAYDTEFVRQYAKRWETLTAYLTPERYAPYYSGENAGYLSHEAKCEFYQKKLSSMIAYICGKDLKQCDLVIYGAGDRGMYFLNRYQEEIGRFRDCYYVDGAPALAGKRIKGFPIYEPSVLAGKREHTVVIVAVDRYYQKNGREIAAKLANEFGYREGTDFLMLDKLDSSSRLEMTKAVLNAPLM